MALAPNSTLPRVTSAELRRWRLDHGLNYSEFGRLLGLTARACAQWERPGREPPYFIAALLHYCECVLKRERKRGPKAAGVVSEFVEADT